MPLARFSVYCTLCSDLNTKRHNIMRRLVPQELAQPSTPNETPPLVGYKEPHAETACDRRTSWAILEPLLPKELLKPEGG